MKRKQQLLALLVTLALALGIFAGCAGKQNTQPPAQSPEPPPIAAPEPSETAPEASLAGSEITDMAGR